MKETTNDHLDITSPSPSLDLVINSRACQEKKSALRVAIDFLPLRPTRSMHSQQRSEIHIREERQNRVRNTNEATHKQLMHGMRRTWEVHDLLTCARLGMNGLDEFHQECALDCYGIANDHPLDLVKPSKYHCSCLDLAV